MRWCCKVFKPFTKCFFPRRWLLQRIWHHSSKKTFFFLEESVTQFKMNIPDQTIWNINSHNLLICYSYFEWPIRMRIMFCLISSLLSTNLKWNSFFFWIRTSKWKKRKRENEKKKEEMEEIFAFFIFDSSDHWTPNSMRFVYRTINDSTNEVWQMWIFRCVVVLPKTSSQTDIILLTKIRTCIREFWKGIVSWSFGVPSFFVHILNTNDCTADIANH